MSVLTFVEMVDIAAMDTNNTELIKGMPETLRFTLNTMTNRTPIVLNLKRKKSVKENSFVFVVRRDKNGKMVLVKENIPVKRVSLLKLGTLDFFFRESIF